MMQPPPRAILLCATPRSGSTLLCSLLTSARVAGRPESWFRREDRHAYAAEWGLAPSPDRPIDPAAFLAAAIAAGQTRNGVFAARIMSETRPELLADLRAVFGTASDRELLATAFGPAQYVSLTRRDTLAQAISLHRAETSGLWHRRADGTPLEQIAGQPDAGGYDFARIDACKARAEAGARDWTDWFVRQGIAPYPLAYEDLAADPVGCTTALLAACGLALPPDAALRPGTAPLADAVSARWATRFRTEQKAAQIAANR